MSDRIIRILTQSFTQILFDEPTSALDPELIGGVLEEGSAKEFFKIRKQKEPGSSCV